MTLNPRLRPILAIQNRRADDDATFPTRRFAGALQARQLGRLVMRPGPKVDIREVMVPVHGGAIRVRLYRPAAAGQLPLHVFLHGGGWCVGDLDSRDPRCRAIAVGAGCVVASVDSLATGRGGVRGDRDRRAAPRLRALTTQRSP